MPIYRNVSRGPRIFNLKGGAQRTLAPGEAADLDIISGPDSDPVLKGWLDAGEIEEAGKEALKAPNDDATKALQEAQQRLAESQAEVLKLQNQLRAAELDQSRRTPPRQLAGDGGPEQTPTVDGQGGALTPSQQKEGRPEPTPQQAEAMRLQRHADNQSRQAEQHRPQPRRG